MDVVISVSRITCCKLTSLCPTSITAKHATVSDQTIFGPDVTVTRRQANYTDAGRRTLH